MQRFDPSSRRTSPFSAPVSRNSRSAGSIAANLSTRPLSASLRAVENFRSLAHNAPLKLCGQMGPRPAEKVRRPRTHNPSPRRASARACAPTRRLGRGGGADCTTARTGSSRSLGSVCVLAPICHAQAVAGSVVAPADGGLGSPRMAYMPRASSGGRHNTFSAANLQVAALLTLTIIVVAGALFAAHHVVLGVTCLAVSVAVACVVVVRFVRVLRPHSIDVRDRWFAARLRHATIWLQILTAAGFVVLVVVAATR
jgi:hypothetical protein